MSVAYITDCAISPVTAPPVLSMRHQSCHCATSPVTALPVLSLRYQSCHCATSPVTAPPVLSLVRPRLFRLCIFKKILTQRTNRHCIFYVARPSSTITSESWKKIIIILLNFFLHYFPVKGWCDEMNIFYGPKKLKQYFLNEHWWFSHIWLVFWKKFQNNVSFCFFEILY